MTLLELIRDEARDESTKLVIAATLSGVANALVIALVTDSASASQDGSMRRFVMVGLGVVLYVVCARRTFHRTTEIIEGALEKIKLRVVQKIEQAELRQFEEVGSGEIYDRLTENVSVISDSAGAIAGVLQSFCVLICALLYILWISAPAFALLVLLSAVGIAQWSAKKDAIRPQLDQEVRKRVSFLDELTDMLRGFKELRFSRKRSQDIREDIAKTAGELRVATVTANNLFNDTFIIAQCLLFAMLTAAVFVVPQYVTIDSSKLLTLIGGVMFFWGPLLGAVNGMPMYIRSNVALANIGALEDKLTRAANGHAAAAKAEDPWGRRFTTLDVAEVSFAYPADEGGRIFSIGPMNLSLDAGEVLFVVGGNGSGKSTFMKVLTGLYPPTGGEVRLNGHAVRPENVTVYREMFSAIFSDFHLFSRLYGLLDADEASVRSLLRQMQIDDVTSFENGRFTKRDLSTGQRKRLAMVVALLEDRPVYLFDEWAADQDPEFRRYFYDELIPLLKRRGKTVIAVSHDDRYFHCADRVMTLEYGKIRSLESTKRSDARSAGVDGAAADGAS